ncbi:diphthine--ammonia ligase [Runella sp. SP2]|uniref:Dph6-related ATP pyrophosphatase n=1 Tax=Runella sp. SP2 TaxID=2268026 RepID=UPI001E31CEB1|nr:diphthine--ammonia ligase [Runella sp. SP2]
MKHKTLMNWSGGKDSALSLYHVLQHPTMEVTQLLTTVNEAYGRVSMHGVREELLDQQAKAIGLPLVKLRLPETVSMEEYHHRMAETLTPLVASGITHSVFGDIFLEDLRQHREERLRPLGLTGVFPLWKRDSLELLNEFWAKGFQTIVVSVNGDVLDKSFCGRVLDADFVKDLPSHIDPCGENGEFHTFVFDAPYFSESIRFHIGETVEKTYHYTTAEGTAITTTYFFTDLVPPMPIQ